MRREKGFGVRNIIVLSVLLAVLSAIPAFAGGNQAKSTSSEKTEIEVFLSPWNAMPIDGYDPYKEWLDKTTGASWKITNAREFTTELTTRAAGGNMPDWIVFDGDTVLFSMYDQGVLLDDWSPYRSVMPLSFKNMGDLAISYFTKNSKLTAISTMPGDQSWAWNIRQDWLNKLGLKMPTTPDELLAVGKAFTFNDPDGNGRNDTYGFTAAKLDNRSLNELEYFGLMYGPISYYVDGGKVNHPFVDGNYKRTLDLIKQMVADGSIDPDWYTVGWQDRKPDMVNGKYGIMWYPPEALHTEIEEVRKDGVVENWWSYLPLPKGTSTGGKLTPASPIGSAIITASASAGKNKAKMDAIIKILEGTQYPNRELWILRAGLDIDKVEPIDIGNRKYVNFAAAEQAGSRTTQNGGFSSYGKMINSMNPLTYGLYGTSPQPNAVARKGMELDSQVTSAQRYPNDATLLNLNYENQTQAKTVADEFTIQYILGQNSDYDGFVRRWLAAGGQALLDEATQQLKGYGIIK
jgi:putative aldouronate transport system substrate-binding protein